MATAASVSTTGSNGLTANKKERNRRDAAIGSKQAEHTTNRRQFYPGSKDEREHPRSLTAQRHAQRHLLFAQGDEKAMML